MGVIPARYLQGFGLPLCDGEFEIESRGVAFYRQPSKKRPMPLFEFKWDDVRSINFDDPGRTKANGAAIVAFGVLGLASRRAFSIVTLATTSKGVGFFETEWPIGTWRGIVPQILADVPQAAGKVLLEGRDLSKPEAESARGEDPIARIAALGELREKGLLSDEEFEAKKQELLRRI